MVVAGLWGSLLLAARTGLVSLQLGQKQPLRAFPEHCPTSAIPCLTPDMEGSSLAPSQLGQPAASFLPI